MEIQEEWHPDLLNKEFFDKLWKNGGLAYRYIKVDPPHFDGKDFNYKKNEIILKKISGVYGKIKKIYLAEEWQKPARMKEIYNIKPTCIRAFYEVYWSNDTVSNENEASLTKFNYEDYKNKQKNLIKEYEKTILIIENLLAK